MVITVKHHSALKGTIGIERNWHGNGEEKGTIGMEKIKRSPFIISVMFTHQSYDLAERIRIFGYQKILILSHTFTMIYFWPPKFRENIFWSFSPGISKTAQ
jgi:hypothetical protein